jgi:hypothetical protein
MDTDKGKSILAFVMVTVLSLLLWGCVFFTVAEGK